MASKQYLGVSKSVLDILSNHKVPAVTTKASDESESSTDSDEARKRVERIRSKLVKKKEQEKKDIKRDSEEEEDDLNCKLEQERREQRKRKMEEIQRDIKCIKRDLQHRKRKAMQGGEDDSKKERELNKAKEQYRGESVKYK